MHRRLPALFPAPLLAALILAAPATAAPSAGASPARIAALGERLEAALAEGRTDEARAAGDSILVLERERRGRGTAALAAAADTLALRCFAAGTARGWELATRYFEESLAIKQAVLGPDDLDVALTLSALAILDDYRGRWEEASVRARRALDIRLRRLGARDPRVASSLRQLGLARLELGDHAEAESLLERSLATYEALEGDHAAAIADGLNNLGELHRVQDRLDRAEASFRRGLEVARARLPADAPARLALMNHLAGIYKDQARYADAEPIVLESLRLRESAAEPDSMAIATGHLSLAEVLRLQDRTEEAAPRYERALAIARSVLGESHPELAPFVNQAAVLYRESGDLDRAEALARESIALAEQTLGSEHLLVAQGLDDYGRLLTARGSYAAAESALRRAHEIRERRLGAAHPDAAVTRIHLAECLSRTAGGDQAAAAALERALPALEASGAHPEARVEGLALRARLGERAGDARAALADLARALAAIDTLRAARGGGELSRAALLARHLDLYHRSVRLHVAAGDLDAALEAHERGRARILMDQLAAGGLDPAAGIPAAEREPLVAAASRARVRLARVQRRLEALRAADLPEAERLERAADLEAARDSAAWEVQRALEAIRERSPLWRRILTENGRPAARPEIVAALAPGEALLAYHVGPEGAFAFLLERGRPPRAAALAVGPDEARALEVAAGPLDAARLERIVAGGARPGIAERLGGSGGVGGFPLAPGERRRLDERLRALGRVLLPEPLAARVRRLPRLAVVPDGALHLLPFEALVLGERAGAVRYWLDEGPALRYAASATSLVELERRDPAREAGPVSVLSVGDPAFARAPAPVPAGARGDAAAAALRGAEAWAPLPGARRETSAIRAAFAPLAVDTLVGAAATEPAVRAALPRHRLLHLATHGFVTERRGDVLAGLVLAAPAGTPAGTEDDGLLQLFEIHGLGLDADLVVLSACETARGPRVAGEGVFALSRGFLAAGARRVVASLWPVNDASTAELMTETFGRLAAALRGGGAVDYPVLVRDAKRALRSRPEYESPFYWAPFVLSGVR